MLSFFDFLGEAIYSIFSMIGNFFHSLLLALATISNSVSYVSSFVFLLPGIIGASVAVVISIAVVKFVIGR